MAKATTTPTATDDPNAVQPVVALCRVTYGSAQTVEPGTIFTPVSAGERTELLDELKAVRKLTDAEAALFGKTGPGTVVEAALSPEPEPIPEGPAEENPLG